MVLQAGACGRLGSRRTFNSLPPDGGRELLHSGQVSLFHIGRTEWPTQITSRARTIGRIRALARVEADAVLIAPWGAHVPMIPDVRAIAADVVLRTMTTGAGNRVTSMIANVVAIAATMISVHVKMAVPAGGVMSAAGMTVPPAALDRPVVGEMTIGAVPSAGMLLVTRIARADGRTIAVAQDGATMTAAAVRPGVTGTGASATVLHAMADGVRRRARMVAVLASATAMIAVTHVDVVRSGRVTIVVPATTGARIAIGRARVSAPARGRGVAIRVVRIVVTATRGDRAEAAPSEAASVVAGRVDALVSAGVAVVSRPVVVRTAAPDAVAMIGKSVMLHPGWRSLPTSPASTRH
ncbi:Hypothetical protein RM25_1310 [Propionibacterium freudenreichii subsp. freudenreichii]|nr:Hypothetical protein RM25_1310 [Propionibacterium freudenreichii subsp. freudenreichii]